MVRVADIQVDLVKRLVTRAGQSVKLSPREYALLAELVLGGGKVMTHGHLLRAVWGEERSGEVQYLRVFVGHLRQKLEADPSRPRIILTVPAVGYRIMTDEPVERGDDQRLHLPDAAVSPASADTPHRS